MTAPLAKKAAAWFRDLPPIRALKTFLRAPFALRAGLREWRVAQTSTYEFAVAAIFKNEARFLDEWLTFHRGIGATQFYLYNNNSTDDYKSVLRAWIDRGLVTLIDWPMQPGQRSAYMHCIQTRWSEAKWIAFIDLDEFLFSPRQVDILSILRVYSDVPALYVYSLNFGSSGHEKRPSIPVVEAYTRREPLAASDSGKSIVNPRYVRDVPNSHCFALWRGQSIDTNRLPASSPKARKPSDGRPVYDVLRAHHYWSRSKQDLIEKVSKGDAFFGGRRRLEDHIEWEKVMNAEADLTILPIWRAIRARLGPT